MQKKDTAYDCKNKLYVLTNPIIALRSVAEAPPALTVDADGDGSDTICLFYAVNRCNAFSHAEEKMPYRIYN